MTPREAVESDVPALAAMLARAFEHDPMFTFLAPEAPTRVARLERFFAATAAHVLVPERASLVADGCEGAALWAPPGAPAVRARHLLATPAIVSAFAGRLCVGGRVFAGMERRHPPEPHHYLAVLAVDPAHQGKGLSTKLLAPTLAAADAAGRRCHLETAKESNVPLYRRFGFDVVEELRVADAPPLWLMTRMPQRV